RFGGEEFAVTLVDTDVEGGKVFAERVRKILAESTIIFDNNQIKLTISLGLAPYKKSYLQHEQWIADADKALYYSKENGRNRVTVYDAIPHAE
ncbi:GGDEF domain-containing protein, partial [Pseudoalteromonas tunicata]